MNRGLILAAAAAAGCLVAAAPAGADPVTLSYDHVVLSVTSAPDNELVTPKTQPFQLAGDLDPSTGNLTVQPGGLTAPTYTLTSPLPGTIALALNGPATGHFDFATGTVTMNIDFIASIALNGVGSCSKDTGVLTLTTQTTSPLRGHNFPAGETGAMTGKGAFGTGWNSLPPGTGPACSLIDPFTSGPGGVWISRGIEPFPKLSFTKVKAPAVHAGSPATVTTTLRNKGAADKKTVKVCLLAPKPLSPGHQCQKVHGSPAGSSKKLRFRVNTRPGTRHTYKLKLTMSGTGITKVTKVVSLKVH